MKKLTFLMGFAAGAIVTRWWRPIMKETIKAGIQAEGKINELTQIAREELEDVATEATEEVIKERQSEQAESAVYQ